MFKTILVCLDGSKLSEQILPYATEEALHFHSKLVLLQVVGGHGTVPIVAGIASSHAVDAAAKQTEKEESEARACLETLAQPLREKGLDVECVMLRHSQAGWAIVDYADGHSVDLIAIATHGRSGLRRLVFGSMAYFVLRKSALPILLVKPKQVDK